MSRITRRFSPLALPVLFAALAGCAGDWPAAVPVAASATLDRYLSRYAPYEMSFDASTLPEHERTMLRKLVEAAAYLDTAYWMQTSVEGLGFRDSLAALPADTLRRKLIALLERNGGPFELLHGDTSFIGAGHAQPGQELYPAGMTAVQFEAEAAKLPEADRAEFLSRYSVIREDGSGGYRAVPYHVEYARWIAPAAALLKEASALSVLSGDTAFGRFLRLKAEALLTDSYFDADTAWVGLTGNRYDIVFGPDEDYSDGIAGIKGKYQANIEVVDVEASKRLDLYTKHLEAMERNLPVGEEYKSVHDGVTARFVVVTDIARTGEAAVGYQAAATNLPNDPEVHRRKGTKKTFWKNVLKGRYNTIVRPVGIRLIHPEQLQYLTNDGFFQFILMHEICHAIGPRVVKAGPDKGKPVNDVLGPDHSPLEEAKADLAGLHSLVFLMDHKVVDRAREKEFFVSYLGSLLRTVRFGVAEAHGKAAAVSLNYLATNGGIVYDASVKRWSVDFGRIRAGVRALTAELVVLEGNGDRAAVTAFFSKWAVMTDALATSLPAVADLPVDILPSYSVRWE